MVVIHGDGSEARTARTLDSSEVLRSENCRVRVREVALMRSEERFGRLSNAIDYARGLDYLMSTLSIVNVVHGAPEKNEPRPVLTCLKREGTSVDVNKEHVGMQL